MQQTNIFKSQKTLYLLLFLVIFSYFLWLNNTLNFSDPDAFYHAKMVDLISQQGIITDFSWLPFTTLNDVYIDHHLLYHLILVPFNFLISSLLVVKLAAVLFASFFIILFQWLLDKLRIKYSFIYTLILLISHQFVFRINLAKVSSLSLIILLLFIYIIFKQQQKWSWLLFLLSFLYVWSYGGWVIGLFLVGLYFILVNIFYYYKNKQLSFKSIQNYKILLSSISGFLAGLIINPYFPTNLKFYWQQTFQIGLVNYKNLVGVGGEWYGLSIFNFIQHNPLLLVIFFSAIIFLVLYKKQYQVQHWFLFISSFIFFILTLKSQRNIEYFVPLSLIFSALIFNKFDIKKEFINLKKKITHSRLILNIICGLLILYAPIIFMAHYQGLKNTLSTNYSFDKYENSMLWLKNNTQEGEIIFHDRWDDWPVFFYYNGYNRYIVGLDPTFMYFKDQEKYNFWREIKDNNIINPCLLINKEFDSNYIFVNSNNEVFNNNLSQDNNCKLVYQDQAGSIYQISNF